MKLLLQTALAILAVTLVTFIGGVFLMFSGMKHSIREEADKDLLQESLLLNKMLDTSPELIQLSHNSILFTALPSGHALISEPILSDTLVLDQNSSAQGKSFPNRVISFEKSIDGLPYRIQILHPLVEDQALLRNFLTYVLGISAVLILLILFSVVMISRRIWSTFYHSLDLIEQFDVRQGKEISFPESRTFEFNQLNKNLQKLTAQVLRDYQNLKEFFEDASHELQTPLAIAQTKLDRLANSPHLQADEIQSLNLAKNSIRKLTHISKDLLMIGKIENHQFGEGNALDLTQLTAEKCLEVAELVELKAVALETDLSGSFMAKMPPNLADILISNLIANSISHNQSGGKIQVKGTSAEIEISNTGSDKALPSPQIFNRFIKDSEGGSSGLGLAIVKRICDGYNLEISYRFADGLHHFTLHNRV